MHPSLFIWFLRSHTNNLNLLRMQRRPTIKLKINILQQKRPDLVAESIGIEMTLEYQTLQQPSSP